MNWLVFLQINLVFAVLVAFYWLLLRNSQQFAWNRWILWGIVVFSFLTPHLPQPFYGKKVAVTRQEVFSPKKKESLPALTENPLSPNQGKEESSFNPEISLSVVFLALYLSGFLFFLIRYSLRLFRLARFLVFSKKEKSGEGYWIVQTDKRVAPFSFFHFIVIGNGAQHPASKAPVLKHEKIHADQWHSVDVLLSEWVKIIFWFNPLTYLYARLLRNNLEYLVDRQMVRAGFNKYDYQYHLLKVGTDNLPFFITNHYNHSFLKQRILMMNAPQNFKGNLLKTGLFVALLLPIMQLFGQPKMPAGENIAVIMTTEASVEELKTLQDELIKLKLQLVFDDLQLDAEGHIENVNYHLYRGNGRIGSSLSPAKLKAKGLLPFSVDFIAIKASGISVGGLKTDELLNNWNDWTLFTAGIDPTKKAVGALQKRMADVQAENDRRWQNIPVEQMEPRVGTTTYKTMDEQRMKYAQEKIQQEINQFGLPPTYFVDGLPRNTNLKEFRPEEIEELEIITIDKPVNKNGEYKRAQLRVNIIRAK